MRDVQAGEIVVIDNAGIHSYMMDNLPLQSKICIRLKYCVSFNHRGTQLLCVNKITVVGKRHFTALTDKHNRLGIKKLACAGSRIADMTYGYIAFGKFFQTLTHSSCVPR